MFVNHMQRQMPGQIAGSRAGELQFCARTEKYEVRMATDLISKPTPRFTLPRDRLRRTVTQNAVKFCGFVLVHALASVHAPVSMLR
jgi:hypothetical protein